MLFVPISDLDGQCGLWSRTELEAMDQKFVAAVEAAFQSGLESRAAACATVRIGSVRNRLLKEQAAIGAAWNWFRDAKFDVPAASPLSACARGLSGGSLLGLEKCDDP